jgi:hypothetical protein
MAPNVLRGVPGTGPDLRGRHAASSSIDKRRLELAELGRAVLVVESMSLLAAIRRRWRVIVLLVLLGAGLGAVPAAAAAGAAGPRCPAPGSVIAMLLSKHLVSDPRGQQQCVRA